MQAFAVHVRRVARCRRSIGDAVRVEYVSKVPRPPLDGLIDDLYYLEGAPPYARLRLPASPAALLIVNLGAPFRIRTASGIETVEYVDGCVITTPTRAFEFGYPVQTRSVGVHFKPWGLAPFLSMPAAELRDRPVTIEQVWGRPAIAELRDRLATADGPHQMLALLEEELMRRLGDAAGLGLVRHTSRVIAATSGAVAIDDLRVSAGVSSTHLAQRFKELIGVTPKRLARAYRFTATVFRSTPPDRSTGASSPAAPATSTRPTSPTSSASSPGSRRPGTSMSGSGSCASIPATLWTAGRCRPIDSLQEGQLASH